MDASGVARGSEANLDGSRRGKPLANGFFSPEWLDNETLTGPVARM
jgi:hypothetical protein